MTTIHDPGDAQARNRADAAVWLPCRACDPYACRPRCGRWLRTITYSTYDAATLGLGCGHGPDCNARKEAAA